MKHLKITSSIKYVLLVVAFTICILNYSCEDNKTEDIKFVNAQGSTLIDEKGEKLRLKGVNIGNWLVPEGYMFKMGQVNSPRKIDELLIELVGPDSTSAFWDKFLTNYIQKVDIKYLKSIGCNHIRLPFHYKLFTQDLYLGERKQGFKYMDRIINWCKEEDIYILLDMHCAPGGQTGDNIDDSYGYPYLLTSDQSKNLTVKIWTEIAERYANEPIVLGYDIVNEPIAHYFDEDMDELNESLYQLYDTTVKAIRTVDQNHLIFLNGSRWSTNFDVFKSPIKDDNIVYEFHKYWFDVKQSEIQDYIDFQNKYNVPIYVGETGENTDEWVYDFRSLLDSNHVNWCFWPYKKMNNTKGVMNFKEPQDYEVIKSYAASDRGSYKKIRENRPDPEVSQKALNEYLESSLFQNCFTNNGYCEGLMLEYQQLGKGN